MVVLRAVSSSRSMTEVEDGLVAMVGVGQRSEAGGCVGSRELGRKEDYPFSPRSIYLDTTKISSS